MPVEIKELVIKVTVQEMTKSAAPSGGGGAQKQDMIQECVEKVMELLSEQNKYR